MRTEKEIAIMEAILAHSESEYFDARPRLDDVENRRLFVAAFERGYLSHQIETQGESHPDEVYVVVSDIDADPNPAFVEIENANGESVRIKSSLPDSIGHRRIGPLYTAPLIDLDNIPDYVIDAGYAEAEDNVPEIFKAMITAYRTGEGPDAEE